MGWDVCMKKKRDRFTEVSWAANVRMTRSEMIWSAPRLTALETSSSTAGVQASTYAQVLGGFGSVGFFGVRF